MSRMTKEEQNKRRSQQRWEAKEKRVKSHVSLLREILQRARENVWTLEKILDVRSEHVIGTEGYQSLPFADKRYIDGAWDELYRQFDSELKWTHVLDGVRFDGWDRSNEEMRKGREHEIHADIHLSCFCYCRELDGEKIYIPFRQGDREQEFARVAGLETKTVLIVMGKK